MTVEELIEELRNYNCNADVEMRFGFCNTSRYLDKIEPYVGLIDTVKEGEDFRKRTRIVVLVAEDNNDCTN